MIILVAGASVSGKTTASRALSERHGLSFVELDRLNHELQSTGLKGMELERKTKAAVDDKLRELLRSGDDYVVEGGWCEPVTAKNLLDVYPGSFFPIFCGYPKAEPLARYELIKNGAHWITRHPKESAVKWIARQVESSAWYRRESAAYDLLFIDFSDIESGSVELARSVESFLVSYRQFRGQYT